MTKKRKGTKMGNAKKGIADVMVGGPIPGGMAPGINNPDPNKLQGMMEQWRNNVALVPPANRYEYDVNAPLLMTDQDRRQQLGETLNQYMPSPNGAGYFDEIGGMEGGPDVGKYKELINKGLWKLMLKDKKDIDEGDISFIQTVNDFIQRPKIQESEAGKGQYRYYFDPTTYLEKQGVVTGGGGSLRRAIQK